MLIIVYKALILRKFFKKGNVSLSKTDNGYSERYTKAY